MPAERMRPISITHCPESLDKKTYVDNKIFH
jgi:hypothetical protein